MEKDKKEEKEEVKDQEGKREENEEDSSANSWWSMANAASGAGWGVLDKVSQATSSAVQAATKKSTEVYGLVSQDLTEVSTQATSAVGSAASKVVKTLEVS